MSAPVQRFFSEAGLVVHTEMPLSSHFVDLVASNDRVIHGVEMKTSLTRHLLRQAHMSQFGVDYAWCAVYSRPRAAGMEQCRRHGFGVLRVAGDTVEVVLWPRLNEPLGWVRARLVEDLRVFAPGGVAGLPTLKGDGPAQACASRVAAYRASRPTATWREIFDQVPNHYHSHRSMSGALRLLMLERD